MKQKYMGLLVLIMTVTVPTVQLKANYVCSDNMNQGFSLSVSLCLWFIHQPFQMIRGGLYVSSNI